MVDRIPARVLSERMRALGLISDRLPDVKPEKTPEEVAAFKARRRAKQRECMARLRAKRGEKEVRAKRRQEKNEWELLFALFDWIIGQ